MEDKDYLNYIYINISNFFKNEEKSLFIFKGLRSKFLKIKRDIYSSYIEIPLIINNKEYGYKYNSIFNLKSYEYFLIDRNTYLKELKNNNISYLKENYKYIPTLKIRIKGIF